MANEVNILNSDSFIDPPEGSTIAKATAGAVALYGGTKAAVNVGKATWGNLLDTQGYGVNSPNPKYASPQKWDQAWSSAMQLSDNSKVGAVKELVHSARTGNPIELKAAEHSIAQIGEELKSTKLSDTARELKSFELKSRQKQIIQRKGLLGNVKLSLGQPINFDLPSDRFEPTTIKVDRQLERLDPASMRGQYGKEVIAMKHKGKQEALYKSYAHNDPRVRHVTNLMAEGKLSEAKTSAKKAIHMKGKNLIIPELNTQGRPVNKKGEQMGMKLLKLGNKVKYKGESKPVYRLKFVPKIRQNLSSKLDYVAGQHWQYMDFVKTNGGYHKLRGGMRDVHNLVPGNRAILTRAEQLVAKPVVNYADWDYQVRTKKPKKVIKTKFNKPSKLLSAYRKLVKYGGTPAARIARKAILKF